MGNDWDEEKINKVILRIYKTAEANINETAWAKANERQAKRNSSVLFKKNENKCNLFVYECILAAGFNVGTPNMAINPFKNLDLLIQWKFARPPTSHDWYYHLVDHFKYIGEGEEGLEKIQNGDILTDNTHMAIAFYDNDEEEWTTIGAGEFTVNKTDWGIARTYNNVKVRIFRFSPGYIGLSNRIP